MKTDKSSIFSEPYDIKVTPHKRILWSVIVITFFILVINLIVSVLCVLVLFDNFKDNSKMILSISILDIILTILTLILESLSTYVSDYMCDSYVKFVNKIKDNNVAMNLGSFNEVLPDSSCVRNRVLKKISTTVKILVIFVCLIGIVASILSDFSSDLNLIKAIALILSVLATFISIYQTFFSTVSCFITGTYTSMLYKMLYNYSKEMSQKYNDVAIQLSQKQDTIYKK